MNEQIIRSIMNKATTEDKVRILGFGSSNTEHFLPGMHWMECLDVALKAQYGRVHCCINAGVGGDTTADLLARYEKDAELYKPHIAIITVGGNDANPEKNISEEMFAENLNTLVNKFNSIGCKVVFQTYYSPIPSTGTDWRVAKFRKLMQIVRDAAESTESGLIDNLKRWDKFRAVSPVKYYELMEDDFHVNHHGNMVMGMDLARFFGADLYIVDKHFFKEAKACQMVMDE